MELYILFLETNYKTAETLGIFSTVEKAKAAAEARRHELNDDQNLGVYELILDDETLLEDYHGFMDPVWTIREYSF